MKQKRKAGFPVPSKGVACLRADIHWNPGYGGEPRTGRLTLRFGTVDGWDGECGSGAYNDPRDYFAITAYVCPKRGIYGWDCGYLETYFIDGQDCEKMARVFKAVEHRLEKLYAQCGQRPSSLGAYVMQVAGAIQCQQVVIRTDDETYARTGERWRCHAADIPYAVDSWALTILANERKVTGISGENAA